jgi:hypothetical protein
MAEYAGRCVALCVMALYAREDAVANSNQAFYTLSVSTGWTRSSGLPWADEVIDLLDEIAVERLPEHLTAHRREQLDQGRPSVSARSASATRRRSGWRASARTSKPACASRRDQ